MEGKSDVLAVTMDPTEVQTRVEAYFASHHDTNGAFALGASSGIRRSPRSSSGALPTR